MLGQPIIEVKELSKVYPNGVCALEKVSLTVYKGEVFGLLGPNGAGKSTFLEILETLGQKTEGFVRVGGYDLIKDKSIIKSMIGVQLQFSTFYPKLCLSELFNLYSALFQKQVLVPELLQELNLWSKRRFYYHQLSGGEKQRLAIGIALLSKPEVLYLDEPSTSLDPSARRNMWQIIRKIQQTGCTVVLSTHYMEEAEFLCDRVAILNHGKIVAIGTPNSLIEDVRKRYAIPNTETITLEEVFVRLTYEQNAKVV